MNDDSNIISLDQKRLEAFWGKPISIYTRAQALTDGVLVDLTSIAMRYGFKIPMACTSAVWHSIEWSQAIEDQKSECTGQSTEGRLHDVMSMASLAAHRAARNDPSSVVEFRVLLVPREDSTVQAKEETLVLVVAGGDQGEPVLTLMLPGED